MATQTGEKVPYEVKIFGHGDPDIGIDGPNFYPYVALCFACETEAAAVQQIEKLLAEGRRVERDLWEGRSYPRHYRCQDEWCGAALSLGGVVLRQWGWTWTDEEIEEAWM